jgi:hypothetical protein
MKQSVWNVTRALHTSLPISGLEIGRWMGMIPARKKIICDVGLLFLDSGPEDYY